ncbi:MAG: sensor histidine kinase, partial [Actinomycetia bacterium]|nr:sensor histidine kinase [Actinomycetes bacterium]
MSSPTPLRIGTARRLQRWARQRPMLIDLGIAAIAGALGIAELTGEDTAGARDPDAIGVALVIVAALALVGRRSMPMLTLTFVTATLCVVYLRDYGALAGPIGLPAIYSVTAHVDHRPRAWIAVTVSGLTFVTVASLSVFQDGQGFGFADAFGVALSLVVAAVGGSIVRNRHDIFVDTEARADRAESDRVAAAQRAVAAERLRIAREMHDVVTHGVGVMAVQAVAAGKILDTQPEQTRDLLLSIETTGRESLMEMRRMLGVLRTDGEPATPSDANLSPQPSLRDLDKLVSDCIAAGTPAELMVTGNRVPLPPGIELAGFRIVQEALTNARKHGGPSVSIRIKLDYSQGDWLQLTIVDTGMGTASLPPATGAGNGLVGMRERVGAYDGELVAGPRPGGGYQVEARLPTTAHQNRHHSDPNNA